MSALFPFPDRVRWCDRDGYLTMEASRLLEVLRDRVGGTLGDLGSDVFASPAPPAPGGMPDVLQPAPAAAPLVDLVQQPVPQDAAADIIQQEAPYTAGTALNLIDYRFALKDTPVVPGDYGDDTHVVQLTIDQQGRITHAESIPISFPEPSGADYSGSLTGKTVTISNGIITSVS